MRVHHGGGRAFVPQQLLDVPYVRSLLEQVRGERVAQAVDGGLLHDSRPRAGRAENMLNAANADMPARILPLEKPFAR